MYQSMLVAFVALSSALTAMAAPVAVPVAGLVMRDTLEVRVPVCVTRAILTVNRLTPTG
jgi:hypothetical protein